MDAAQQLVHFLHGQVLAILDAHLGGDLSVDVQAEVVAEVAHVGHGEDLAVDGGAGHLLGAPDGLELVGGVGVVLIQADDLAVLHEHGKGRAEDGGDVHLVAGEQQVALLGPVADRHEQQLEADAVLFLGDGVDGVLHLGGVGHVIDGRHGHDDLVALRQRGNDGQRAQQQRGAKHKRDEFLHGITSTINGNRRFVDNIIST